MSLNDKKTLPMRKYTELKKTQLVEMETLSKYNLFLPPVFFYRKRILGK
jgi:hypothetical protein